MKYLKSSTLAIAFLLPTVAHAEVPQGLTIFGSAGYVGASLDLTTTDTNESFTGLGKNDTATEFGVEYSFGGETSLAIGAKYLSGYDFFSFDTDEGQLDISDDGGYALYISPRVEIGESSLIFATLGQIEADGEGSTGNETLTVDLEGNYYGFGIRTYFEEGTFLQVSAERVNYDSLTEGNLAMDAEATKGLITFGVTF